MATNAHKANNTNQSSALAAALNALAPVAAHEEELTKRLRHYTNVLTPFSGINEGMRVSLEDRRDAETYIGSIRIELEKVARERRRLDAEVERARAAERDDIREKFLGPKRRAIQALKAALLAAALASDEVKAIQYAEHEQLGEPFDPLSWPDFDGRLEQWLATVKSYGLD